MTLIPHVSNDYTDGTTRYFSFDLLVRDGGAKATSHATITFQDNKVTRLITTDRFQARQKALVRLARRYMARSIPAVFPPR